MDSWPEKQLKIMKLGGNQACNAYLAKHGVPKNTPIKQKYESPAAQLYKEILKARCEGRPEPTQLPKPIPKKQPVGDAQGMERLPGESDQQYIARQTRLRDEAKQRMAAKFGNGGMGGSGMGGSRMQGIGSDPHYNPNAANADFDVGNLVTGLGSMMGSALNTAKGLADERTVDSIKSTGASFWGGLTSTVGQVAANIAAPENGDDGLTQLQRDIASHKPGTSKYSGFGSDTNNSAATSFGANTTPPRSGNSFGSAPRSGNSFGSAQAPTQEAPGLPGEDRNGVERLTGETDEQYVVRQTRLRDEARARMAAKFGGGGLSSSAPRSTPPPPVTRSAPSSGNAPTMAPKSANAFPRNKTPPKKQMNTSDFFSSFGA